MLSKGVQKMYLVSLKIASAILLGLTVGASALAQAADNYPNRSITMVVAFPAAGTTDILARLIGQKLTEKFKQTVVVENRPGAGGNIGTAYVAKAAPDGYTIMMGTIGTQSINPSLYKKMPYDAAKDFVPITRAAMVPNLLVVNKDAPFNTLPEMMAYGKANPGKLTYGSSGNGTTLHLSGELFNLMSGSKITHIPYKGSTPAVADLMGGQISMIFDNMPSVIQQVKSGRLKALAVTSAQRNAQLPEIPTIQELGVAGYEVWSWFGLLAPAATPKPIVDKLNASIVDIIKQPDVQTKIIELGAVPVPETSAEFGAFIEAETLKWAKVIKEANIGMD
jgi:tripartite-type tricarboxylate transporter receptor subunit TctC